MDNMKFNDIDLRDYKLVIFDIDDTLVGKEHVLDLFTKEVLFRLRGGGGILFYSGNRKESAINKAAGG